MSDTGSCPTCAVCGIRGDQVMLVGLGYLDGANAWICLPCQEESDRLLITSEESRYLQDQIIHPEHLENA